MVGGNDSSLLCRGYIELLYSLDDGEVMPTMNFAAASGEWNTAANWNLSTDAGVHRVPLSTDDTTFTGIDGSAALTITTTAAVAKSVDFKTARAVFTLSGSQNLTVSGSLTCKAGMTWSHNGLLIFAASGNLDSRGIVMACAVYIGSTSIALSIETNPLNIGTATLGIRNAGSSLITNNETITCGTFGDGGVAGDVTLNLGTSTINCSNVSFAAATLTVTPGTAANITITNTGDFTADFGEADWHETTVTVVATGGKVVTIGDTAGTMSLDKLKVSWTTNNINSALSLAGNITLANATSDALELVGSTVWARPMVCSDVYGTARHIHANTTDITSAIDFRDIHFGPHTVDLSAITSGNLGGNEGITFRAADDYYLDGTTYDYDMNQNCWSLSSGGGAGGTGVFPLPQDTIYIDNNSWDSTGHTFVFSYRVGNVDASALTEANTLSLGNTTYYGDLILTGSGITVTSTGATVNVDGRLKNESADTLDINSLPSIGSGNVTIDSYGGTVQLASALTHTGTFTFTRGNLDLNGQTLTTKFFSWSNANTCVLHNDSGTGKIVVTQVTGDGIDMTTETNHSVHDPVAIDAGDSTLTLTGNVNLKFASTVAKTFGALSFKKYAGNFAYIVSGTGNTFGNVTQETPDAA
jgi:hypothetical protein